MLFFSVSFTWSFELVLWKSEKKNKNKINDDVDIDGFILRSLKWICLSLIFFFYFVVARNFQIPRRKHFNCITFTWNTTEFYNTQEWTGINENTFYYKYFTVCRKKTWYAYKKFPFTMIHIAQSTKYHFENVLHCFIGKLLVYLYTSTDYTYTI